MASTPEQLRGLYTQEQLAALDKVRDALEKSPGALDNHKKAEEKASG